MKRIATVTVLILLALPAWADFGDGLEAFERADYETAFREWLPLAVQGDADSQCYLGRLYQSGYGLFPKDPVEGMKWFQLAADQGHADAQLSLGTMYLWGDVVPQDYAEAATWYRLAADQGDAQAQNNLGVMYDFGKGVPQDYAEAVTWYQLAADQGYADAQYNLDMMSGSSGGLKVIIPQLAGALVAIGLLTRLSNLIMRRVGAKPLGWSHLIVGIIAVVGGAFGFADGGPPAWQHSATYYLPTTALWLWFDFFAEKRRRSA